MSWDGLLNTWNYSINKILNHSTKWKLGENTPKLSNLSNTMCPTYRKRAEIRITEILTKIMHLVKYFMKILKGQWLYLFIYIFIYPFIFFLFLSHSKQCSEVTPDLWSGGLRGPYVDAYIEPRSVVWKAGAVPMYSHSCPNFISNTCCIIVEYAY